MAHVSLADARIWQIFSLGLLLTYGVAVLGFDQTPTNIALIVSTALATQWLCGRFIAGVPFDPLSSLITSFSLCLLLRAAGPEFLVLGAVLAIASKFILRFDGKHIFNPGNFGIAVMLLFTDAPGSRRRNGAARPGRRSSSSASPAWCSRAPGAPTSPLPSSAPTSPSCSCAPSISATRWRSR
jgi:hypothetical protein